MNKTFLLSLTLLGLMVYDPLMDAAPQVKPRSKAARAWAKHRKWVIPTATALGLLAVGGGAYALHRRQKNGHTSTVPGSPTSLPGGSMVQVDSSAPVHQSAAMVSAPGRVEDRLAGAPEGAAPPVQPFSILEVPQYGNQCCWGSARGTLREALVADPSSFTAGSSCSLDFLSPQTLKPAITLMRNAGFEPVKYFSLHIIGAASSLKTIIFLDKKNRCIEIAGRDGSPIVAYPNDIKAITVFSPFVQQDGLLNALERRCEVTP